MDSETGKVLKMFFVRLTGLEEVAAIGMSGEKGPLPKAGEGDMDIFIYCRELPKESQRQMILEELAGFSADGKINALTGGHWGVADYVRICGVDTWFMYFTTEETRSHLEDVLAGRYPDKLDNYYYPVGRLAMLEKIQVLYEKDGFLSRIQEQLQNYPESLGRRLAAHHREKLTDVEDLERAVLREDVLFYHFALDLAIDHFLQCLFAMNRIYFPSRKRTVSFLRRFGCKPEACEERLLQVLQLGGTPENIRESYAVWKGLVAELNALQGNC